MFMRTILGVFLIVASSICNADETRQSLELIKDKVEHYVLKSLSTQENQSITVSADRIDQRLNLKACHEENLELFNPYQTSILRTSTIGVKCNEKDIHWTLYVPVTIQVKKPVIVAKRTLRQGSAISLDDIDFIELDLSQLKQGHFSQAEEVVGQVCKQTIMEGTAITPNSLKVAQVVMKDEQVSIQVTGDNFSVSMPGVALSGGTIGDTIKVRNSSSKKIVEARISGPHQVKVNI